MQSISTDKTGREGLDMKVSAGNDPGEFSALNGLVLAGGHSRRMGQPKSVLDYHGKPQYRHIAQLLERFCKQVFISCRAEQLRLFEGYPTLLDSERFGDIGPMNGVLSAFDSQPCAWFVLGCDYPFLTETDLKQLIGARDPASVATVFSNPANGFPEPLIGIYEPHAQPLLLEWHRQGNESLRRFLEKQKAHIILPQHPQCLTSVDTPEEYRRIRP